MNDRKQIDIYKAILRLDETEEPFDEFGPNHPKIGDFVNPSDYFQVISPTSWRDLVQVS